MSTNAETATPAVTTFRQWVAESHGWVLPERTDPDSRPAVDDYIPPLNGVEATFRPFVLYRDRALIEEMLKDLPRILQQYPDPALPAVWKEFWRRGKNAARDSFIRTDFSVGFYWHYLTNNISIMCEFLDLQQRLEPEIYTIASNVRLTDALTVDGEYRVGLVWKTDVVYLGYENEINKLEGVEWLNWDGRRRVQGAKAMIIKVCPSKRRFIKSSCSLFFCSC